MSKKRAGFFMLMLIVSVMSSVLLASCIRPGTTPPGTASKGGTPTSGTSSKATVHMGNTNFLQSSVTISKGGSITLTDDVNVTHIISNGSWVNGTAKPATEPGAPVVKDMTFNAAGQSKTIGPFNTPGTYHYYCSVHPNMNLTVIVTSGPPTSTSGATVHLGPTNFKVSSITISKGSMLTIVDDVSVEHILKNGSWVNGTQHLAKEPGAPTVNVTFTGKDTHKIGPFNSPGTYHILCIIHPNMNLTVIVK